MSELERLLGKIFGPSTRKTPIGEGKEATPISLRSTVRAQPNGESLVAAGQVELSLVKNVPPQKVRLSVALRVLDEQGHMKDHIALSAKGEAGLTLVDGALVGEFYLEEASKLSFDLESEKYDKDWTVAFLPVVTPVEAEEEA